MEPIRIAGDSSGVIGAASSPDGQTIVAIVGTNRVTGIGKDGLVLKDVVPTLPSISVLQPSAYMSVIWLADHHVLIRQAYPGGLLVADYITGSAHVLPKSGLDPSPSPDGQRLALGYYTLEPFYSVYVTDLEFKSPRKLTADSVTESSPAWSPDGQWIAYAANVGFADQSPSIAWELRIVRPDGTGQRTLISRRQDVSYPTIRWSPDGQRVAFTEYDVSSHRHRVGIIGKDDAESVTLTNDSTNAFVLGWIR